MNFSGVSLHSPEIGVCQPKVYGTDCEIRGAEIVVTDKNAKLSRIRHALQLLYPLEAKELCSKEPKELSVKQNIAEPVTHRKSKREAALTGKLLRKLRS